MHCWTHPSSVYVWEQKRCWALIYGLPFVAGSVRTLSWACFSYFWEGRCSSVSRGHQQEHRPQIQHPWSHILRFFIQSLNYILLQKCTWECQQLTYLLKVKFRIVISLLTQHEITLSQNYKNICLKCVQDLSRVY